MLIEASYRLLAEGDWFHAMSHEHQQAYLAEHPNSKYAKDAKQAPQDDKVDPKEATSLKTALTHSKEAITNTLRDKLKDVKGSALALKALSTGKPLTEDHKTSLKNVAHKAVDIAISYVPGGPPAKLLAKIGFSVVMMCFKRIRDGKVDVKDHSKEIVSSLIHHVGHMLNPMKANMKVEAKTRLATAHTIIEAAQHAQVQFKDGTEHKVSYYADPNKGRGNFSLKSPGLPNLWFEKENGQYSVNTFVVEGTHLVYGPNVFKTGESEAKGAYLKGIAKFWKAV